MATGTIQKDNVLLYSLSSVSPDNVITLTITKSACVIFAMRKSTKGDLFEAMMVEYWNPTPWHFGSNVTSGLTITKSANSYSFTLVNSSSAGAVSLIVIGASITP